MLRTDRARIPRLLHDWEAFTVKSLKLTKYWKPTPFPCDDVAIARLPRSLPRPGHQDRSRLKRG
jgi:hypothetical protein